MEPTLLTSLAGHTNLGLFMLLCSGPLFGLVILFMVYYLINKFTPEFIKAVNNISEQTNLMRELLHEMRKDLDEVQRELKDIKVTTSDNNKRLEEFNIRLKG